nr:alpha-N-acetylglucosaminidase-like [Quercus suber]
MSNSNSLFLLLILTLTLLLPTALTLSQPKPIQALLKHLDSKRASPSVQEAAAKAVLKRLLPECYVPSFQFKIVPRDVCGGQCCFLISNYNSSSKNGPEIMIKGTTAVEIASGLYWYLKYWCGAHVSWDKTGGVQIASIPKPGSMPLVKDDGVMIQRPVPWNYYQNVVTSSYSYVWWDWERWEKEIDWMALHGVNLPLAFVGQEAIWQKVFMDFNISKDDLNDFFGGPAFLAWARMGNLHGWGGPLTQNWLDQQLALQKRILSRMLELGMTPVLPSFSGNIPAALKKISPSANITKLGNWNSVDAKCRWSCTYLLDPSDPLFVEIGEAFIRRQVEGAPFFCRLFTWNSTILCTVRSGGAPQIVAYVARADCCVAFLFCAFVGFSWLEILRQSIDWFEGQVRKEKIMSEVRSSDLETGLLYSGNPVEGDTAVSSPRVVRAFHALEEVCGLDAETTSRFKDRFQFPERVRVRRPSDEDRACHFFPGEVCFYKAAFTCGLRFPVHPFLMELLNHFGIVLGQLMPNSWRIVVNCMKIWLAANRDMIKAGELVHLYRLKESKEYGYYELVPWERRTRIIRGLPSSFKYWKSSFFFVSEDDFETPSNQEWGDIPRLLRR